MDLTNKVVLITGGTGSFGREFIDLALKEFNPGAIRVYSRGEHRQHEMQQRIPDDRLRFLIGDVRDRERLFRAMNGVDIVIHAAALKQVTIAEYNPIEAVRTNIVGAINVIDAAIDNEVERVIAISTDKAVYPVNLYGATKLVAEKLFSQGNSYTGERATKFGCVRYGNVIGSQGSVIPLFLEQKASKVLTITDPEMTRFWITLEQGVRFVAKCTELMDGGEIFVPKIPSMRIKDVAEAIAPECKQKIVGIRPGEKLHEVLLSEDEAHQASEFDDMFVITPPVPWVASDKWAAGAPVPDGYRYGSDSNTQWLTHEELRAVSEPMADRAPAGR